MSREVLASKIGKSAVTIEKYESELTPELRVKLREVALAANRPDLGEFIDPERCRQKQYKSTIEIPTHLVLNEEVATWALQFFQAIASAPPKSIQAIEALIDAASPDRLTKEAHADQRRTVDRLLGDSAEIINNPISSRTGGKKLGKGKGRIDRAAG